MFTRIVSALSTTGHTGRPQVWGLLAAFWITPIIEHGDFFPPLSFVVGNGDGR